MKQTGEAADILSLFDVPLFSGTAINHHFQRWKIKPREQYDKDGNRS